MSIDAGLLPARAAEILGARYGLTGGPPLTLVDLAAKARMSAIRLAVVEHDLMAHSLSICRGRWAAPAIARPRVTSTSQKRG
jgi:hypothetical protein